MAWVGYWDSIETALRELRELRAGAACNGRDLAAIAMILTEAAAERGRRVETKAQQAAKTKPVAKFPAAWWPLPSRGRPP
eukprot:4489018-Prymnesium_polylepis.1